MLKVAWPCTVERQWHAVRIEFPKGGTVAAECGDFGATAFGVTVAEDLGVAQKRSCSLEIASKRKTEDTVAVRFSVARRPSA